MASAASVAVAAGAFVGTHFLLSHPLRAPMVARLGERGFLLVYSVVALATLWWLSEAYRAAPETVPWWPVSDAIWAAATVVMLLASVLFAGSLLGNPALPTGGAPAAVPEEARGVFAVTRHPMMWAFALWGLVHIAIYPIEANVVLAGSVMLLALAGAAGQDAKKSGDPAWAAWRARTSYWPFAAVAAGRARLGWPGWGAVGGGVALWLIATWAHLPLGGWAAAGVWRWVPLG